MPRTKFVEVSVALGRLDPAAPDHDARVAEVLREHGVSAEEMEAFVEARSGEPEELAAVWEEVADSVAPQPEPVQSAQEAAAAEAVSKVAPGTVVDIPGVTPEGRVDTLQAVPSPPGPAAPDPELGPGGVPRGQKPPAALPPGDDLPPPPGLPARRPLDKVSPTKLPPQR